eukprot:scaffold206715_cov15-Tisochrysis_lutea.AAC.1
MLLKCRGVGRGTPPRALSRIDAIPATRLGFPVPSCCPQQSTLICPRPVGYKQAAVVEWVQALLAPAVTQANVFDTTRAHLDGHRLTSPLVSALLYHGETCESVETWRWIVMGHAECHAATTTTAPPTPTVSPTSYTSRKSWTVAVCVCVTVGEEVRWVRQLSPREARKR